MHLTRELVSYKEQIKIDEAIVKLKIIRDHKLNNFKKTDISQKYRMHRNTVWKIIKDFEKKISPDFQSILLNKQNLSHFEILEMLSPLKNKSTKPLGNKRSANKQQEEMIKKYITEQELKVGYKRMHMLLKRMNLSLRTEDEASRTDALILKDLTFSQLKGIYKRNGFKVKKVRVYNKTSKPLYDYEKLACFERLHYDTKDILDKKALPKDIYKKFDLCKDLPIIEWNIIDVKSRFRFIAYSHARTSEFGLEFLLFVIQFIRSTNVLQTHKITIGTDNGCEFFSGSKRKMKEWNNILNMLNAEIYSYEPGFDVRKNLIERSHRTDDEEFFVPRGRFIKRKKDFLLEATNYANYFNGLRPHSGIGMDGRTPIEKLESCGLYNAKKLLQFPTMILENHISKIKKSTALIRLLSYLKQHKITDLFSLDQKTLCDIKSNFKFFPHYAQNVLHYYLIF